MSAVPVAETHEPIHGKPWLKVLLSLILTVQIMIFSADNLESDLSSTGQRSINPDELLDVILPKEARLAPGIPEDRIPDYSIDHFHFIATRAGNREWKIVSRYAHLYSKEDIIHGKEVTAYLYDEVGKATLVEGREAKYRQQAGELEIFGNVTTTFPDGFKVYSDYMKYFSKTRFITVPNTERVVGIGRVSGADEFSFHSFGLDYDLTKNLIFLHTEVNMTLRKPATKTTPEQKTTIDSDECSIDRTTKLAHFTMRQNRPLAERFVRLTQPNLFVRSRRVELFYGGEKGFLKSLFAYDDVFIHETDSKDQSLRYATCGQAEFDQNNNLIILTRYPQVYQDSDTVTGEVIVIHRDTDVIEIKQSNAFSEGSKNNPKDNPRNH